MSQPISEANEAGGCLPTARNSEVQAAGWFGDPTALTTMLRGSLALGNWEVGKALLSLLTLSLLRGPRYACKCQVGLPQANDTTAAVLFALVVIVSRSLATFTDVYPSSAHHTKAQPHRPFGWLAGRLSSLGRFVERSAEARSACLCMVQLSLRHWRDW